MAHPLYQVSASQFHIDDDDEGDPGCELDATHVTPTRAKGQKKRSCPYSASPAMVQKIAKDSEDQRAYC